MVADNSTEDRLAEIASRVSIAIGGISVDLTALVDSACFLSAAKQIQEITELLDTQSEKTEPSWLHCKPKRSKRDPKYWK